MLTTPKRSGRVDSEAGFALAMTVVILGVLLTLAASSIQLTRSELHSTADQAARQEAFYVAEAGIQRGIAQLDWERAMASTYTTYSYSGASESFADGSYTVSIVQDPLFSTDPTRKLITSTGTKASQQAQLAAHVAVKPISSSNPPGPTPTLGVSTTPTPGGAAAPTFGPPTPSGPVSTPTPGPPPTSTSGVPPGMPTPTPTPAGCSPPCGVCENHELLVSYNGTAKMITKVAVGSQLFDGTIFSNGDVTFQVDAAIANNATGSVFARGNFNNQGTALSVLSNLTGANLFRVGSYQAAALDPLLHLVLCGALTCQGVHFGTTAPQHGTVSAIPQARQWQPDYTQLKRFANAIVNKDSQPFGSWDSASGTWVVGGYTFPAGTQTHYYVDGNVQLSGISLTRTASPWIVARGWISMTSLQVLSAGLLAGDVQNIYLLGEKDVMIGRDVLNLTIPTFQSEATALTLAQGIRLLSALDHTTNVFAYSQRGEVWGMVNNLTALSKPRICFLGSQNATLAFTGTILSTVHSLH